MTKSLGDKLKELFFPEKVPLYKITLLAGLFSVALLHTIGSQIYHGLKENKKKENMLWKNELIELKKEKNSLKNKLDSMYNCSDILKNKNQSYRESMQEYEN